MRQGGREGEVGRDGGWERETKRRRDREIKRHNDRETASDKETKRQIGRQRDKVRQRESPMDREEKGTSNKIDNPVNRACCSFRPQRHRKNKDHAYLPVDHRPELGADVVGFGSVSGVAIARTENVDDRQHLRAVHQHIFLQPTPPQSIVHDLHLTGMETLQSTS